MENLEAVRALAALAQETRLDVFRLLVEAGMSGRAAGTLGRELGVAPATLSFHLKELRNAGIVTCSKDGRSVIYRADFGAMNRLMAYLMDNCCQSGECAGETEECVALAGQP